MKTLTKDEINFLKYNGIPLNHDELVRLGIPDQGCVSIEDGLKLPKSLALPRVLTCECFVGESLPFLFREVANFFENQKLKREHIGDVTTHELDDGWCIQIYYMREMELPK